MLAKKLMQFKQDCVTMNLKLIYIALISLWHN